MESPIIDPPIRGEWKVIHNPGDAPHALDFIGVEPGKRLPYPLRSLVPHLIYRIPTPVAYGWDRPVRAPFSGDVIEARDGYPDTMKMNLMRDLLRNVVFLPDLSEDVQRFAGNYVIIQSSQGVTFIAHLQRGSVTCASGSTVTVGEEIGTVGNAGASLAPHLHFQMMSEWSTNIQSIAEKVIPFRFSRYERREDGAWRTVRNQRPESGERIRIRTETSQ